VQWSSNGVAHRIGQGIAYDVNATGDIVGDNERLFGETGQPMLWHNGRGIVLDRRHGSAYGIADDGTIVGQVGQNAFIATAGKPNAPIRLLDGRLADHRWHISPLMASGRVDKFLLQHAGAPELSKSFFSTESADRSTEGAYVERLCSPSNGCSA